MLGSDLYSPISIQYHRLIYRQKHEISLGTKLGTWRNTFDQQFSLGINSLLVRNSAQVHHMGVQAGLDYIYYRSQNTLLESSYGILSYSALAYVYKVDKKRLVILAMAGPTISTVPANHYQVNTLSLYAQISMAWAF